MKPMSLTSPEDIAREYGGNKKKISEAARIGLLDPTSALLAGMFIDKMRAAAAAEQNQNTTVLEDTFGGGLQALPTPPQQRVPPMPVQPAPQAAPQPQLAQAAPPTPQPMMAASGGIMHIPAGDVGNYAGGGIVAFDEGGEVPGYAVGGDTYGGRAWEELAPVERKPRWASEYVTNIFEPQGRRKDPITGEEISLTQFLEKAQRERAGVTPDNPFATVAALADKKPAPKAKNSLIDPEFRKASPAQANQARLDILRKELADEQQKLTAATSPEDKARAQANITALNREIAAAGKSSPTSTAGFGKISKIPSGDPSIAARREALSLPAIPTSGLSTSPDFVGQARGIAESVFPAGEKPTELTVDTAFEQSKQFLDKAGVDLEVFKKQREDIAEERQAMAKDKKQAMAMRIVEGAALILSGESPHGLVNIGKGLSPMMQGLASDVKEFQKNERALRAAKRQLDVDEQKFNLTRASDAQAQMLKSQERVDKYNQNKIGLISDLTKSFISNAGQKDVAKIYTEGSRKLEELRQSAPPDIVKLADRLKKDMPGKTEQERLEAAADILYPGRGLAAVIGAESKASQAIEEQFQDELFADKKLRETNTKAQRGDADAQREIDAVRKKIRDRVYANRPLLSSRMGETPQTGAAPPRPATLPTNAPPGSAFGNFVPGMGWEIKDKSGTLIGYGQ